MSVEWIVVLLCSLSASLSEQSAAQGPALILDEDQEFAAIQAIHGQLDDNADGSVDARESSEFVETELCGANLESRQSCRSSDKSKRFHQTDKLITSLELWATWHNNKVINWTTEDVVLWLENTVGLPEYSENFRRQKITGHHLPQIATNTDQILQNFLLIGNSRHKQKIQLRAMDVILFGPPATSGYWKDVLLALSVVLGVCGLVYAFRQRQVTQSKIDSFLEDFRVKEEELSILKAKLELEKTMGDSECQDDESSGSMPTPPSEEDESLSSVPLSGSVRSCSQEICGSAYSQVQEENESLRTQLRLLEKQIVSQSNKMSQLQGLLQECCKKEWAHLDSKRRAAEDQMSRAHKVCDKIKKKRYSLFGTFHLANSSSLEEAGLQITKAVNKMHSISDCFDEYHKRWEQIEQVCDFSIISSSSSPIHKPLLHKDSLLSFTSGSSSLSLNSVGSLASSQLSRQQKNSPESGWRVSARSASVSSRSSVEDTSEARMSAYSQSLAQMENLGESESDSGIVSPLGKVRMGDWSPLTHSVSVPAFKKSALSDQTSASDSVLADISGGISFGITGSAERKGLEPIREEKRGSPVQRRTISLNKKSRSSDV